MHFRSPLLIPGRTRESTGIKGATRPVMLGTAAAWRTPAVIDRSLPELLAPTTLGPVRAHPADARRAVAMSHKVLGAFARVLPTRWRSTSLYRSVAECLVLRTLGHPAHVVIVGADDGPRGVIAHAWVECTGIDCVSTRDAAELERTSSHRG